MNQNPLGKAFYMLCRISPDCKRFLWHLWYNYIVNLDREKELLFMNYGYAEASPEDSPLTLQASEEKYRNRIQLYRHVAEAVDMTGKEVLEVGCGCGGGAAYIAAHFGPSIVKGLDYSQNAIKSAKKYHAAVPNVTFIHGDAEALPFDAGSFDIIVNVESSHTYGRPGRFFSEAYRVLRPQGWFLLADFRGKLLIPVLRQRLRDAGFQVLREENITRNILKALELDHEYKMSLIQPGIIQQSFHVFSGTKNSRMYKYFESGGMEYLFFVLQKGKAQ